MDVGQNLSFFLCIIKIQKISKVYLSKKKVQYATNFILKTMLPTI